MDNEVIEKKTPVWKDNLKKLAEPENIQKYILGTKKNGNPRALYDVIKDYTVPKKKKKKKKKYNPYSAFDVTVSKKKKKKKKKDKYWHI